MPRTGNATHSFAARYHGKAALELPYMQKSIFAFCECEDGADVAFFSLMGQEYGGDCPYPNTNTAYISYLDSNQLYHCHGCAAEHDKVGADCWTAAGGSGAEKAAGGGQQGGCSMPEACRRERREVYHALFLGYLDYLKRRHFARAYIW